MSRPGLHDRIAEILAEAQISLNNGDSAHQYRTDISRAAPALRDWLVAWDKPNPFNRGDIVKAHKSSLWRENLGHVIVLATHARTEVTMQEHFVLSHDMRVLALESGGLAREVMVHSRDFELVERAP